MFIFWHDLCEIARAVGIAQHCAALPINFLRVSYGCDSVCVTDIFVYEFNDGFFIYNLLWSKSPSRQLCWVM